mmetsp:Transcript_6945/g.14961  ORF Transcript_6945/g.14961 Transcript_6945/m.14961 type:complete len:550 (-) Transcript_6945:3297-4946(-)
MKESISIDAIHFRGERSPVIHNDVNQICRTHLAPTDWKMFISNFDNSAETSAKDKRRITDVRADALDAVESLGRLPSDVLFQIFLYCGPRDVDEGIKLVNRRFYKSTSLSLVLWKEFCTLTGKSVILDSNAALDPTSMSNCVFERAVAEPHSNKDGDNCFRQFYYRNPCVPIDFTTITEALKFCPRAPVQNVFPQSEVGVFYSNISTVVLMPGVYHERIRIEGEKWAVGGGARAIAIRAAFPFIGAAIVHYDCASRQGEGDFLQNEPCISISTVDASDVERAIAVRLSHLAILHSTPGADIWGGNTAVWVDGARAQVTVDSCVLQSDTGRGIVVTNQAELQMFRSSIANCAATGFYLGDWGSRARIVRCNILNNGFGAKIGRHEQNGEEHDFPNDTGNRLAGVGRGWGLPHGRTSLQFVPPGHSGVYIESSTAFLDDNLIAGNSLTGLSVVRSGFVHLSGCDITGNGHSNPILVEDAHDLRDVNRLQGIGISGGLVEGPTKNNFASLTIGGDEGSSKIVKGGPLRRTPLSHLAYQGPMFMKGLFDLFRG